MKQIYLPFILLSLIALVGCDWARPGSNVETIGGDLISDQKTESQIQTSDNDEIGSTKTESYKIEDNFIRIFNTGLINSEDDIRIWTANKTFNLYHELGGTTPIKQVNKGDQFTGLKAEYRFYKRLTVNITNAPESLVRGWCPDENPFSKGGKVEILNSFGEGYWNVLYKGKVITAHFALEEELGKITRAMYDGCPIIEGDIIQNKERYELWVRIKTSANVEGWIKVPFETGDPYIWFQINPNQY